LFLGLDVISRLNGIWTSGFATSYSKFRFSEKATAFLSYFHLYLTSLNNFKIRRKITPNFCNLLRKPELFKEIHKLKDKIWMKAISSNLG
jgi:hypothetical protein